MNTNFDAIIFIVLALAAFLILIFCLNRKFYYLLVIGSFSLIITGFAGFEPFAVFIPILFTIGVLFQHISLKVFSSSFFIRSFFFVMFSILSFQVGEKHYNEIYRFVAALIFFYFFSHFASTGTDIKRIFFSILIGTLFSSLIAVLIVSGIINPPAGLFLDIYSTFRFAGLYNATILAIFSAILLIWVIDETLFPKIWLQGFILKIFIIIILVVQILATLTRSSWVGFIIAFCYYLISNYNHIRINVKRLLSFLLIFSISIGSAISLMEKVGLIDLLENRVNNSTTSNLDDVEVRRANFYFTKNALALVPEHPLGVGLGNAKLLTNPLWNDKEFPVGAHNFLAHVFSELGWIPFIMFVSLLYTLVTATYRLSKKNSIVMGISSRMLLSCFIILIVAGMYQDLILFIPMWLIPAIAYRIIFSKT